MVLKVEVFISSLRLLLALTIGCPHQFNLFQVQQRALAMIVMHLMKINVWLHKKVPIYNPRCKAIKLIGFLAKELQSLNYRDQNGFS